MPAMFTFGAGVERIEVRLSEFDNSSPEYESLAHPLDSTVKLNIGAFSGSFNAVFATPELIVLHEQLARALQSGLGTFAFRNLGGDLALKIEFKDPGRGIITGTIQPHLLRQATLNFSFDVVPSSLARTAQELEDVLRAVPH